MGDRDRSDGLVAPPSVSRRTFLCASLATTVALPSVLAACDDGSAPVAPGEEDGAVPVDWAPSDVAEDLERFRLGVQAGAMGPHRVLLWTHHGEGDPVRLRVWRDGSQEGQVLLVQDLQVAGIDGYALVPVDSLTAGTWYRYGFFDDALESRSVLGAFRTAHAPGSLDPVTVAATACTHFSRTPYASLHLAAKQEFDVLCHLGDMSYNDGATTTAAFRERWASTLQEPAYRDILSQAGLYITLDDHEITNDSERYDLPDEIYQTGLDAFFETVAIERLDGNRFWQSYRWGDSVEFFVLDSRTERQPDTRLTDEAIYLGLDQMAWLKEGLSASPCHFKVLLNSVPITAFPEAWPSAADRWQGYASQRDELLDFITDQAIPNVWFLTGDMHAGLVSRVEREGPRRAIWEIMVGPGAPHYGNVLPGMVDFEPALREDVIPADQFAYASGENAATLVTFDPGNDAVHVRFLHAVTEETLYEATLRQGA